MGTTQPCGTTSTRYESHRGDEEDVVCGAFLGESKNHTAEKPANPITQIIQRGRSSRSIYVTPSYKIPTVGKITIVSPADC